MYFLEYRIFICYKFIKDNLVNNKGDGNKMFFKKACTMQHDASDCGAAAISTILLTYKQEMSIMKIR